MPSLSRHLILAAASAALVAPVSWAQTAPPSWTVTGSLTGAEASGEGSPQVTSGSIGLTRQADTWWLGASIGSSRGSARVPEIVTVADQSSVQGSLWWGTRLGLADVEFSLAAGRQELEGDVRINTAAPLALRGRLGAVAGEINSAGGAVTVSRTFGESVFVTPSATLSYDTSETSVSILGSGSFGFESENEVSGVSGRLGLDLARSLDTRWTISGGGGFNYAEDASAQNLTRSAGRFVQPSLNQQTGSAEWADLYGSLSVLASEHVTLGASLGTTAGRDDDEVVFGLSAARQF